MQDANDEQVDLSRTLMALFFIGTGGHYFSQPDLYLPLVSGNGAFELQLNQLTMGLKILFGILVLVRKYRRTGIIGLILLLLAFFPAHIHFIKTGACIQDGFCSPLWIAWFRLLIVHPFLLLWVWSNR